MDFPICFLWKMSSFFHLVLPVERPRLSRYGLLPSLRLDGDPAVQIDVHGGTVRDSDGAKVGQG